MSLPARLRAIIDEPAAGEVELLVDDRANGEAGVDAAVLVPVIDLPEPRVILTQRTEHLPSHPGQVAFPGGKVDPGDDGPIGAALRESEEEIGLPRDRVEIIGTADIYRTGTGFDITPVIGIVPPGIELVPEEGEVAAIFDVPFDTLFAPANYDQRSVRWEGYDRTYFEMYWDDRRIWGVTAAIIINLARRMEAVKR